MNERRGKIIIEAGLNVWDHELRTAEALASVGHIVEFIRKSNVKYEKTADTLIDGIPWEFKAPRSSRLKAVERNLRRGLEQSSSIVFDSRRMKGVPDKAIERELHTCAHSRVKGIRHLMFVNRKGEVIDIM